MTNGAEQLKGDGTLYTIYTLIASEAQILGGYTITPKLKGSWVQAFPMMLFNFFKLL